jgi:hypothetical protein
MVKRFLEDRRAVLFLSLVGIVSLAFLASALNSVSLDRPRQPLYHSEKNQTGQDALAKAVESILAIPFWEQIALLITFFMIVVLIASLLSPEMRKRLIKMVIRMTLTALAIIYLFKSYPEILNGLLHPPGEFANGAPAIAPSENGAPPVFEPPHISNALSFFIALGIILIFALMMWAAYVWWKRQNESSGNPLNNIAKVARMSLDELSREASPDAIIRCYERMSEAVGKRRGVERGYAMTAAEFAQKLRNTGLPDEPVNRLTRLFESARYSTHTSTQKDIDEAVLCLTSILRYCGEKT